MVSIAINKCRADIRNEDCLVGLSKLEPESAHFAATDPPYFLDGMGGDWDKAQLRRRIKPGVIGGLPAGMKFDRRQARDLKRFIYDVGVKLHQALKPGGFAAVFSQARLAYAVGAALDEAGFEVRDMLIWKYEGQAKAFSQNHFVNRMDISEAEKSEIIKELDGKKTPQLKPQFEPIILAQKPRQGTFVENWLRHKTGLMSPAQSLIGAGFPGTVIEAPKPKTGARLGHLTVKPVAVMRQLIRLFTIEGQTVLDPFIGSGTSLAEAARLRLPAGGCDLNAAAVILSRVYEFANLDADCRRTALDERRGRLDGVIPPSYGPLFGCERRGSGNRTGLEAALVGLWRGSGSDTERKLAAALIVLCDFHRGALDAATVHRTWLRLEDTVLALPHSTKPVAVYEADARALPIESRSVNLVLTSPPYINVHNYHQKYRRSIEAMGWNVLAKAPSEIGSNRQNRGNRFLTVIQYSLDMALVLREMVRISGTDARLILVLGRESKVRGMRFLNGALVTEIAVKSVGLDIERRQERVFRNRFGNEIYEDILHFRPKGEIPDRNLALTEARRIAGQALSAARPDLRDDIGSGIDEALARLDTVSPSPMPSSDPRAMGFD